MSWIEGLRELTTREIALRYDRRVVRQFELSACVLLLWILTVVHGIFAGDDVVGGLRISVDVNYLGVGRLWKVRNSCQRINSFTFFLLHHSQLRLTKMLSVGVYQVVRCRVFLDVVRRVAQSNAILLP